MCQGDGQGTSTNKIANRAENVGLGGREIGDSPVILCVLGIAEENDALDLVRDCGADCRDRTGNDGGALAVECVS